MNLWWRTYGIDLVAWRRWKDFLKTFLHIDTKREDGYLSPRLVIRDNGKRIDSREFLVRIPDFNTYEEGKHLLLIIHKKDTKQVTFESNLNEEETVNLMQYRKAKGDSCWGTISVYDRNKT